MEIQERAVYTTSEAAQILKLSPVTVERKIRRGEIPATKIGREYRLLGRDMLSLFGWEKDGFSEKFNHLWKEIREKAERAGYTAKDVSSLIEDVRRKK